MLATGEMPLLKDDKERKRYYLLPGMGGPAYRRKQMFMLKFAIVAGLIMSLIIALVILYLHNSSM